MKQNRAEHTTYYSVVCDTHKLLIILHAVLRLLTPKCKILIENLIVAQLVKKFSGF
jgi:hypothetical protein